MQQRAVHHDRMIFSQQLSPYFIRCTIRDRSPYPVVASISTPPLKLELMIGLVYLVRSTWIVRAQQFTVQMRVVTPYEKLVRLVGVIPELKIDVIVCQCSTTTERDRA